MKGTGAETQIDVTGDEKPTSLHGANIWNPRDTSILISDQSQSISHRKIIRVRTLNILFILL